MPRQARQKSSSGIYHIILRGINRQTIFDEAEDNVRFIETMRNYKAISGFELYAYCLMDNHIHILLKTGQEDVDLVVKRVAGSYAYWYNLKYRRNGHLFQDRYKSEAVEDDKYFLAVLRYIHQNPVTAGLCKAAAEYKYSSYGAYSSDDSGLVDIGFALSMTDKEAFIRFNNEKNDDEHLDIDEGGNRINDADAKEIIKSVSSCANATEFQSLERVHRDRYIKELRAKGLSIRQISRLTGTSFGIVRKQ